MNETQPVFAEKRACFRKNLIVFPVVFCSLVACGDFLGGAGGHFCRDVRWMGCQLTHPEHKVDEKLKGPLLAALDANEGLHPKMAWAMKIPVGGDNLPKARFDALAGFIRKSQESFRRETGLGSFSVDVQQVPADYSPGKGDWVFGIFSRSMPKNSFHTCFLDRNGFPSMPGLFPSEYHHLATFVSGEGLRQLTEVGEKEEPGRTLFRNLFLLLTANRIKDWEHPTGFGVPIEPKEWKAWVRDNVHVDSIFRVPAALMSLDDSTPYPCRKIMVRWGERVPNDSEFLRALAAVTPFLSADGWCIFGEKDHGICLLETWIRHLQSLDGNLAKQALNLELDPKGKMELQFLLTPSADPSADLAVEQFSIPRPPELKIPEHSFRSWHSAWDPFGRGGIAILPEGFPDDKVPQASTILRRIMALFKEF